MDAGTLLGWGLMVTLVGGGAIWGVFDMLRSLRHILIRRDARRMMREAGWSESAIKAQLGK